MFDTARKDFDVYMTALEEICEKKGYSEKELKGAEMNVRMDIKRFMINAIDSISQASKNNPYYTSYTIEMKKRNYEEMEDI